MLEDICIFDCCGIVWEEIWSGGFLVSCLLCVFFIFFGIVGKVCEYNILVFGEFM